ncbi:hypothetical protein STEG23_012291 [Scotinomys teguina]
MPAHAQVMDPDPTVRELLKQMKLHNCFAYAEGLVKAQNQKLMCAVNVLTDVATTYPDKKSILMYITSLFQVLPQHVSMEAIQEVEMLPRPSKVTREEHFQLHHQMHYSQQITVSLAQGYEQTSSPKPRFKSYAYTQAAYVATSDSTRSPFPSQHLEASEEKAFGSSLMETEVNLDSYQTALEEVLSWLLCAEDTLQAQGEISTDVEKVKDQFHAHEGFMMDLTSHQGRVGNVLQLGSQIVGKGKLSEDEETEVQEQMNLLNSRWECLRVASMEKQSKGITVHEYKYLSPHSSITIPPTTNIIIIIIIIINVILSFMTPYLSKYQLLWP